MEFCNSKLRGSTDILAAIDCHLSVKINKSINQLTITQNKLRSAPENKPFNLGIKANDDTFVFEHQGDSDTVAPNKKVKAKEKIKEFLRINGASERQELIDEFDGELGANAIGDALKELVSEKAVVVTKKAKGKNVYELIDGIEGDDEGEESSKKGKMHSDEEDEEFDDEDDENWIDPMSVEF